jgi:hypothetical protein
MGYIFTCYLSAICGGVGNMFRPRIVIFPALLLVLQACASIIDGTTQTITVESTPAGADCRFLREGMVVANVTTPGGVVVEKTKHDMTVECEKDGYQVTRANLDSGIEDSTWGNIILGGGIGWAIDSAAGADNKYPEYVNLTLVPMAGSMPTLQTAGGTAFGGSAVNVGERWVGQAAQDACGSRWAMDLQIRGRDLIGTVWRDEVEYSVRGSMGIQGEITKARAAKKAAYQTVPAPRFLAIHLSFVGDEAHGQYGIDSYGRIECLTPIMLGKL